MRQTPTSNFFLTNSRTNSPCHLHYFILWKMFTKHQRVLNNGHPPERKATLTVATRGPKFCTMYYSHVTDFHHVSALGHDVIDGAICCFSLVTLVAITLSTGGGLSRLLPPPKSRWSLTQWKLRIITELLQPPFRMFVHNYHEANDWGGYVTRLNMIHLHVSVGTPVIIVQMSW